MCETDAHCPADQYCSTPCRSSSCHVAGRCSDRCTPGSCEMGVCDGRRCTCFLDSDCPTLYRCRDTALCEGGPSCGPKSCQYDGCRDDAECRTAFDEGSPRLSGNLKAVDRDSLYCWHKSCQGGCGTSADCVASASQGGRWSLSYASVAESLVCVLATPVRGDQFNTCLVPCSGDEECASIAPMIFSTGDVSGICIDEF
jgi:hypothetical protein